MRVEHAVRVVRNLRRYRMKKRCTAYNRTVWDQAGPFVPQNVIPMGTRSQERRAKIVLESKAHLGAVRWIDVGRIRSTQHSLRFKSLMWNVKNAARMQRTFASKDMAVKGVNLPIVIWVDGVAVIWNGNHRVTANILLGRTRILVRMYKLRRPRWSSAAR